MINRTEILHLNIISLYVFFGTAGCFFCFNFLDGSDFFLKVNIFNSQSTDFLIKDLFDTGSSSGFAVLTKFFDIKTKLEQVK